MKRLALIAVLAATPVFAAPIADLPRADAPALVHMDLAATEALKNAMKPTFDSGQLNMLKSVAHQQVVVITCDGFNIDKARFETEMNLVYDDAKGKPKLLTPAQRVALDKKAMFGFGMAMGAQIALAAYDEKAFCASAERERATLGFKHGIWVKQVR